MSHLLEVKELTTAFTGDYGKNISVDHVDFYVDEGEVVCIVGESGCGKSVTSLSIMGLLKKDGKVSEGEILFEGKNLLSMTEKELDEIRGDQMTMIFQDPLTSLNPVFTVGCNPKLLIADEPTTALDVTIQAQIMKLLKELQKENGMSIILITHDIGVVANMADRVLVMYAGQIIEEAPASVLFTSPRHPYTRALLDTVPTIRDTKERKLVAIPGMVPENYDDITGCRFAQRCPYRREECGQPQEDYEFGVGHRARCVVMKEGGIPI